MEINGMEKHFLTLQFLLTKIPRTEISKTLIGHSSFSTDSILNSIIIIQRTFPPIIQDHNKKSDSFLGGVQFVAERTLKNNLINLRELCSAWEGQAGGCSMFTVHILWRYKIQLTFPISPLPVGLIDVDVSGETEVWDLADLAVSEEDIPGGEVPVNQL